MSPIPLTINPALKALGLSPNSTNRLFLRKQWRGTRIEWNDGRAIQAYSPADLEAIRQIIPAAILAADVIQGKGNKAATMARDNAMATAHQWREGAQETGLHHRLIRNKICDDLRALIDGAGIVRAVGEVQPYAFYVWAYRPNTDEIEQVFQRKGWDYSLAAGHGPFGPPTVAYVIYFHSSQGRI